MEMDTKNRLSVTRSWEEKRGNWFYYCRNKGESMISMSLGDLRDRHDKKSCICMKS